MTDPETRPRRPYKRFHCAIYTRKSTDEGLEQAFNSLDAQREACAAFILSQKHEGWTVLPAQYDDGGYSGGTMERPALQRLLADIEAGQVDVVVVYKVDRLTRALSDFAKLVEVFDRRAVSFVSITQQFNTTSSMGRLTLNVLLSFAQFEREVIGERVRDKIAASKKKGMWMGGMPPLGYDVKDRKLVINSSEAQTVVDIFRRYVALKSVRDLHHELVAAGIRSKRRVRPDGTPYGGQEIARGALYLMLQNRIYRGEITHKGQSYPGQHPAIIDQPLWDEVQAVLAQNRIERATGAHAKDPSLLGGLVFDASGERLTPSYAIKKGTRYRYYVSSSLVRGTKSRAAARWRIPAGDLEGLVIGRVREFFCDPSALLDAFDDETHPGSWRYHLSERGHQIAEEFRLETTHKAKASLMALLCRVTIYPDRIEIGISCARTVELLAGASIDLATLHQNTVTTRRDLMALRVSARLKRVGREMRMLVEGADDKADVDASLVRVVARAHDIQRRLSQNTGLTVHDVARQERVTAAYIYTLLRLPWLAPDITTAIVNGRQPCHLSAKRLMNNASRLPADWTEQRTLLGF
jgi:site-specific DNA recombinase